MREAGRRFRLALAAAVLLLGACGGGSAGSGGGNGSGRDGNGSSSGGGSAAPAASIGTAQPAFCEGDTVVSAQAADTAEPVTVAEMQARLLVGDAAAPGGFRYQTVVVDEGLGSFRLAVPTSFSPVWRNGTPGDELIALAEERDPVWAEFWGARVGGGALARAITLDTARQDEVVAVLVTLTPAGEESGDSLAASFADTYGSEGSLLGESCGVRANGTDGAYVEHTVPSATLGGGEDRTQLQFLIPDPPNGALWGVTCDVERGRASDLKELCRQIASTFEPLPEIVT